MTKKRFLEAQWTNLLMLNYVVDPEMLKPYLPFATVPDLWQGKALVSMVGFMFEDTKVLGVKWPFHIDFEEVNLRFYVKHFDGEKWKRGAVFVSEIVPKPAISIIANTLYREHYSALSMRHSVTPVDGDHTQYSYEWKLKGKWNKLHAIVSNRFEDIKSNSPEEFIFEHYWGYNTWDKSVTVEYQVEHISWQVAAVKEPVFEADIAALYGEMFVPLLSVKPYSAFFAKGSDVVIRMGSKIRANHTQ